MTTAKQKAWRAEFARRYGRGKRAKSTQTRKRGVRSKQMARRKSRRGGRRGGAGFLKGKGMFGAKLGMGVLGTAIIGVLAGYAAQKYAGQGKIGQAVAGMVAAGPVGAGAGYFSSDIIAKIPGVATAAPATTSLAAYGY